MTHLANRCTSCNKDYNTRKRVCDSCKGELEKIYSMQCTFEGCQYQCDQSSKECPQCGQEMEEYDDE